MGENIVYSSEYLVVTKRKDGYYIESFKNGMSIEDVNSMISKHTEIKITSFMAIKNAILFAPKPPVKFGEVRNRISVDISSDELKAYITLCIPEKELEESNKGVLIKEIINKLTESGVVFGIKNDVLSGQLCNNKQILIAEGLNPVNGEDSIIRMYEVLNPKPEAKEDGNVDHYELNLINKVKKGDWLGERRDPTPGSSGKSVKGATLMPLPGKKYPLIYDKKSVREIYENGVTRLEALFDGAVNYEGERIRVVNHLEIQGNVNFKTGNIDFSGFLTVKGSVEDNFSIAADKDIEILGEYGIGSVREIISRNGKIFIKGGIAGKNKAIIKSRSDIYTKYVSDATIICDGTVHIGYYCLNSNITAKEVIIDSPKGQIIGGNIQAEIKVAAAVIGAPSEKRTVIKVKGFDRNALMEQLEKNISKVEILKNTLSRYKQELSNFSNESALTNEQRTVYGRIRDDYFDLKNEIKCIEDEKRAIVNYLRTRGEGEIIVIKKVYPKTYIEIKNHPKEIERAIINTSFYIQDGELKEL